LVATIHHPRLPIHAATFSPDGNGVVTAGSDRTARVWNSRTGEAVTPPLIHGDEVVSATFSPDNSKVVTGSLDHTARVWDARTGALVGMPMPHSNEVLHVQFDGDGRKVLTMTARGAEGSGAFLWDLAEPSSRPRLFPHHQDDVPPRFTRDGAKLLTLTVTNRATSAAVWDAASGRLLTSLTPHSVPISALDLAPDGHSWIVGAADGWVKVLSPLLGKAANVSMRHSADVVMSAQFSDDGQLAATAALDQLVLIWDPRTGNRVREPIHHDFYGTTAVFSPDSHQVATGSFDKTARLWDVRFRGALNEPLRHGGRIHATAFSQDGERLLTASDDQTARVWDCASRQPIGSPLVHEAPVIAGRFQKEAGQVLTLSRNGQLRIWDAQSATVLSQITVQTGEVDHAQFGADGKSLLLAHSTGLRVWDMDAGRPSVPAMASTRLPHLARISPDGRKMVRVARVYQNMGANEAQVWDLKTSKLVGRLEHSGAITSVDFSPDSARVATAAYDDGARVWDLASMKEVATFQGSAAFNLACFSPDGTKVLCASVDRTATIWDARTGRELTEPMRQSNVVYAATFSPDETMVALVGKDRSLLVWDVATGLPMTEPSYHPAAVRTVEFSPDGRRVVTVCEDHAARVWEVPLPDVPAPSWMGSLAKFIAVGTSRESGRSPEELWRDFVAIRALVTNNMAGDFYTRWARWFLSDPNKRTISPWSTMRTEDYILRRIEEGTLASLREAVQLQPTNGLALARLAEKILELEAPEKAAEAEWLLQRGMKFSPNDPEVRRIRAARGPAAVADPHGGSRTAR
jgi:WD40 repeat protein